MKKGLLFSLLLMCAVSVHAQTEDWKQIHIGNREFRSGRYDAAEVAYRKALLQSPNNARAYFNLGDTYMAKKNPDAAMQQFKLATRYEKNPHIKSMAFHNMGYINQRAALTAPVEQRQQFLLQAIDNYKDALRQNPDNEQSRYNLALCQKQLKKNKGSDNQNNKKQQDKNQQQKQQQKQQQSSQNQHSSNQQQQQSDQQVQQLLNLARQSEEQAKEKVNQAQPKRKNKKNNW
ncbi:hypothetical protein HMPREF9332_01702 [Alloprevotella rava F0323]|uniref:Uncharacterized protein n=1 Tax=Alloprevotella rava F0323 TaxID=679199 RepID=G5GDQ1_9BACT|nr:tetratricopeptide repeat protein [Alloprevotella rava]EHG21595.1 hypothetical protein HMPREF9332_01702 [Alloprevotella rava F0323]